MRPSYLLSGLALALALAGTARADPVLASGDTTKPSETIIVTPVSSNVYEIGAAARVDVTYDPNAGPWIKTLVGVDPGPVTNPTPAQLIENLHVVGRAWTDWHQEITTPLWHWLVEGININIPNTTWVFSNEFRTVDFIFPNPLPESTQITISKWFSGPAGTGPQNVVIQQWPTVPEPGTIALLLTGLLAAGLGYIWRRRK